MFACTNTCFCAQTLANLSKNRSINVVQTRSKSLKIARKWFETARNCLKWLKDCSQPPPPPPPPLPTVSTVYEQCTNTSIPVSTPSVLTPPLVSQHLPLFQDLCLNVNPAALPHTLACKARHRGDVETLMLGYNLDYPRLKSRTSEIATSVHGEGRSTA